MWSPRDRRLYWFDINNSKLHWLETGRGDAGEARLPLRASAAAPRATGGLLMATESGLALFDPAAGTFELVEPMTFGDGFRTNDGKIDPQGRFWWSTMQPGGEQAGALFRTDPQHGTSKVMDGVYIPNTVSVSADGATLYLADSKLGVLFALATDDLSRRRVFARAEPPATPDGSAIDAEGYLWNAQWGGWRLVRYAPDGSVDRVVEMPVEQPTSCAFGGPELATLYITSAREGLSEAQLAGQPDAGCLFAFEPGVRGMALP